MEFFKFLYFYRLNIIVSPKDSVYQLLYRCLDALGLISLSAKVFMQKLWKSKLGWDHYLASLLLIERKDLFHKFSSLLSLKSFFFANNEVLQI